MTNLPNHPDDGEKKAKGLLAGKRGHGFAEIMPDPRAAHLAKLKALIPRKRKARRKRRRQN